MLQFLDVCRNITEMEEFQRSLMTVDSWTIWSNRRRASLLLQLELNFYSMFYTKNLFILMWIWKMFLLVPLASIFFQQATGKYQTHEKHGIFQLRAVRSKMVHYKEALLRKSILETRSAISYKGKQASLLLY